MNTSLAIDRAYIINTRKAFYEPLKNKNPAFAKDTLKKVQFAQVNETVIFTIIYKNQRKETFSPLSKLFIAIGNLISEKDQLIKRQLVQERLVHKLSSRAHHHLQQNFPSYIVHNELCRLSYMTALSFIQNPEAKESLRAEITPYLEQIPGPIIKPVIDYIEESLEKAQKKRKYLLRGDGESICQYVLQKSEKAALLLLEQERKKGMLLITAIITIIAVVIIKSWSK